MKMKCCIAVVLCRFASALKALEKLTGSDAEKPAKKEVFALRANLLAKLRWSHWEQCERDALRVRFPTSYPLF